MVKLKNVNNKKKQAIIMIAFIIILGIGVTLAWWRWSSQINALIYGEVCAPEIVFVGGTTINGTDLLPVRTKEEGLTKDIYVNLNNSCPNDTAVLNLNLTLENFPSGLSDASFKWGLYEVTEEEVNSVPTETLTYVNSGTFANKAQTDVISLAEDLVVTSNISTYRLFIWIDALMDNPSAIGGNTFRFKIYGEGYGALYNQYTMASKSNTTATSSFWGSSINANQVRSIRFIPSDQVSEEWTNTYDVSSVANSGDIIMYYVENGATTGDDPITLYDVYVASNSGTTKTRANTGASSMFANLTNCEYIDAENLDTSNVTNMYQMFMNDSKLDTLKISSWDTSKVTNMQNMFNNTGTSNLIINLSNFSVSRVTNMAGMFKDCKAYSIDVSNFSNENVTNMTQLFNGCKAYSINLTNFQTPKITGMGGGSWLGMFQNCSNVEKLDLSSFDVSKVNDMGYTFSGCTNLKELNLNGWNTASLTNMSATFQNCSSLKSLDLSSFKLNNTNLNGAFNGCAQLESIIFDTKNVQKVKNLYDAFRNCTKLKNINLSSFDTSTATSMYRTFQNCSSLETLDLSSFTTPNVTSMGSMFQGCSKLKSLDLNKFNTENVTSFSSMFSGCTSLEYLDVSNFNTKGVTTLQDLFRGLSALSELKLTNFKTNTITNMFSMFNGCTKLESLDLSSFNTENLTNMSYMFSGCSNITELDLHTFTSESLTNISYTFNGCSSLTKIDISNLDLSDITTYTSSIRYVPTSTEIIVEDCSDFTSKFGSSYTNAHLANETYCTEQLNA